ncbi:MAG: cell division protein FtsZ [Candidatus Celaenobacter polaris]|nr:cell division protein FtsZ [Candidatus Celaenobacter polaris]
MLKFNHSANKISKIKIIGIGGAGNNAVNTMIINNLGGVDYVAVNTDLQVLNVSAAEDKLQIGKTLVKGFGAGGKPEVGKMCAEESKDDIKKTLVHTDVVFLTAGMGGGTGTGAAPIFAKIAKEMDILTIAIVTYPFSFEGKYRKENAEKGIAELKQCVNSLIIIDNDKVLQTYDDIELYQAFEKSNFVLYNAAKTFTEIINKEGYMNVDLADVKTVLSEMGYALIGFGSATGEDRAAKATHQALENPLIQDISLEESKAILVNITVGFDFITKEYEEVTKIIYEKTNENTNIIHGLVFDKDLKDVISIAIIATGMLTTDRKEIDISLPELEKQTAEDRQKELEVIMARIKQSELLAPKNNEYSMDEIRRQYIKDTSE